MKLYKARNKQTGEYFRGEWWASWSIHGKMYQKLGVLKNSLKKRYHNNLQRLNDEVEIVILEVKEIGTEKV